MDKRILITELKAEKVQAEGVLVLCSVQVWECTNGSYSVVCSPLGCGAVNCSSFPSFAYAIDYAKKEFSKLSNII